jgi:polynucleotide 5'-kinase involved in rRNA processing
LKKIKEKLGVNPVHCGETASSFVIVLGKNQRAKTERILSLEKELGKKIKLIREGAEKGLLVGLHDAQENFLGIGILNRIDYERRVLQIYTSVKTNVFSIHIGQVKLDRKGNEIGIYPIFKNCNLT